MNKQSADEKKSITGKMHNRKRGSRQLKLAVSLLRRELFVAFVSVQLFAVDFFLSYFLLLSPFSKNYELQLTSFNDKELQIL